MLHVFVDTNIFLSLYAYTDDKIEELRKLIALIREDQLKLYLTSLVNQEFNRNRDNKILEAMGSFEKFSTALSLPRFMEHYPEAEDLRSLLKEVSKKHKLIIQKSKAEIADLDLAADKLFKEIREVATLGAITDAMDKAGRQRLERNNPPGKSGSLGDRLNWEYLLKTVPDRCDLHIISKDKDFASPWGESIPHSFLKLEWDAVKNGNLFLYGSLRSFASQHFPEIQLASDAPKKLAIKRLEGAKRSAEVHKALAELSPFVMDFSDEEAQKLFCALTENDEIRKLVESEDVKDFYENLLVNNWGALSEKDYKRVTDLVPDPIPF